MVAPAKLNFKIYQGSTFKEVLRWESGTKIYVPITNITKSAPMVVSAPAHGAPLGWRARVTSVVGMKEANTDTYSIISAATNDTVTFNSINSLGYSTYTSGGVLEYYKPVELLDYTGVMQIREKLDSNTVLLELNSTNSTILFDDSLGTITLVIPAATTAALTFTTAVYSLELTKNGETLTLAKGTITLEKEVTR